MPETNYLLEARSDAIGTIGEFMDQIVDSILGEGSASDDLMNDYIDGDSYHHENHVDKEYSLSEAAEVLDQLSDHEETDSGLWESLEPRKAISCQAAFTYGNAVYSEWRDLIEKINQSDAVESIKLVADEIDMTDELKKVCKKLVKAIIE